MKYFKIIIVLWLSLSCEEIVTPPEIENIENTGKVNNGNKKESIFALGNVNVDDLPKHATIENQGKIYHCLIYFRH